MSSKHAMFVILLAGCPSRQTPAPPPAASTVESKLATAQAPSPSAGPAASVGATEGPSASGAGKWNFDSDAPGAPPSGFSFGKTGSGKPGQWVVRTAPDAPSAPNVLAQVDADTTDYRFPVAVANESTWCDVRLSVRCKPVSGKVDQACGLVFRYR